MKNRKWLVGPLALVLCNGALTIPAQAQRVPDKEARQQQNRDRLENMSPEEREAFRQQRRARRASGPNAQNAEKRGRKLLTDAGFGDKAVQDAIIAFIEAQRVARQPLLEMAQRIAAGLRDENVTDAQTRDLLAAFRQASDEDKARYEKALDELDAKIHYSTTPKLEAFLTLIGVLGDEATTLGNRNAIFLIQPNGNRENAANNASNAAQD